MGERDSLDYARKVSLRRLFEQEFESVAACAIAAYFVDGDWVALKAALQKAASAEYEACRRMEQDFP